MDNNRLNKRVFLWSESATNSNVKNWSHKVKAKFTNLDLNHFSNTNNMYGYKHVLTCINDKCMEVYKDKWLGAVNRQNAAQGQCRNKLRTYSKFKYEYTGEPY